MVQDRNVVTTDLQYEVIFGILNWVISSDLPSRSPVAVLVACNFCTVVQQLTIYTDIVHHSASAIADLLL